MGKSSTFKIEKLEYRVKFTEAPVKTALVSTVLQFSAENKTVILGSLLIDGHEILPSFRIALKAGTNDVELRTFKVIRPIGPPNVYRMELKLALSEDEIFTELREIEIVQE